MAETIIFFLAAGVALIAALGVVLAKNPVHSALLLVSVLVAVAIIFLLQDAQLVAAVQIIVYAGAIVVLFLFVIMLLGVDRMESLQDPVRLQRPAAIVLGVVAVAEVLFLAGHHWATGASSTTAALHGGQDTNIQRVAKALFTDFLWPFEVTSVLLVAAVVGGVVLARRSGAPPEPEIADEDDEEDAEVQEEVSAS